MSNVFCNIKKSKNQMDSKHIFQKCFINKYKLKNYFSMSN
ncbi:hypothetical protein RIEPE_0280 [Candidatus Riesia pediculicola USDA]|uniref:Uncharacterized protein n=1 Tax=Riesia pediculicola (strain USDA) TaxID=515618 RepID=D4G875_RIEPU|nr:hypothetical protein RIEPE_0280 [Candidatus Riesia pediculicola USDA]